MDKFQNKYRVPSNRNPNWDYSDDGIYFLTIVTQHRECNLGKIVFPQKNDDGVETHGRASLQSPPATPQSPLSPVSPDIFNEIIKRNSPIRLPNSISSFVAGFKSAVNSKIDDYIVQNNLNITKYNRNNHVFQPNYHDHIIRNSAEFERIQNYIINNPLNWGDDKLYG